MALRDGLLQNGLRHLPHHFRTLYTHIKLIMQNNQFQQKIARDYISTHTISIILYIPFASLF